MSHFHVGEWSSFQLLPLVLGILFIIPLALLVDKFFFRPTDYDEHSLGTMVYLAFGVPILILNL